MPTTPAVPKVIESAPVVEVQRLIELFPVSSIRETWSQYSGKKDEIARSVAEAKKGPDFVEFLQKNFSCCRQHIYLIKSNGKKIDVADITVPSATQIDIQVSDDTTAILFLWEVSFEVVTRDPIELETLKFLVPVKVEIFGNNLAIRFVILEKDLSSYSKTGYRSIERLGLREEDVVDLLSTELKTKNGLQPLDIHKGTKKLWDDGMFRSSKTKYKNPRSTSTEEMDSELDIKTHQPTRYLEIKAAPIINQLLFVDGMGKDFSVKKFTCSPGEGYLSFNAYSENAGDTDDVVREIIKAN